MPESFDPYDYANTHDHERKGVYERREADWRMGALVYQVMVDRFAPSADLDAKRHLYPAPKRLRGWDELPAKRPYNPEARLYEHEIEFWGGDLASTAANLNYVEGLGADVLYLCPIHLAYTNHGYDALDYLQVRPEYGTRDDLKALAGSLHERDMKLVLDGVFNHLGRHSELFQEASASPDSPKHGWFEFDQSYPGGARAWYNAENLPELLIENPEVADYVYRGHDSVIRSYLRDGADGWRLDVAFDLGMRHLGEITKAAHEELPGSLVLGEITSYPQEWYPELDGILHLSLRRMLMHIGAGLVAPGQAQRLLRRFFSDADYEHLLTSWVYLENHDTPRISHDVPNPAAVDLLRVLQFTLPGCANVYYGAELGMPGDEDPENRAPMRWDLVSDDNRVLAHTRTLIDIRKNHRSLRVGDIRWLETERLIGFERHTDRIRDAVIVLANPSDEPVREFVYLPDSKIMDGQIADLLGGESFRIWGCSTMVELPAWGTLILAPDVDPVGGYTSYKRVQ